MKEVHEAAVRMGLALYRKTVSEGAHFYSLYDLAFEEDSVLPRSLFGRLFTGRDNFWSTQEDIAQVLDGAGLAQIQRSQLYGSGSGDFSVMLTPLGKALYSLAYLHSDDRIGEIEGLRIEDLATVLGDEENAVALGFSLRDAGRQIDNLNLSNFQRSAVQSYVDMLSLICDMPEKDTKLFWLILERLNNFSGVASLIVALIALKLSR